jgi:hypothetical protein
MRWVGMRLPIVAAVLAFAVLLPAAPAAAATCEDKKLDFTGSAREAEFTGGGGPLGKRRLTVGDPVDGKLAVQQAYYVPAGKSLKVEFGGYTYRVGERGVFGLGCTFGKPSVLHFRHMEGRVTVSGPSFTGNPKGYVITPEASFLPLPGKPSYTVKRTVTDSPKTTRSTVSAASSSAGMFVKASGAIGKKIPCQAGKAVTIFLDGHYRNG